MIKFIEERKTTTNVGIDLSNNRIINLSKYVPNKSWGNGFIFLNHTIANWIHLLKSYNSKLD